VGKTTLAEQVLKQYGEKAVRLDVENPDLALRLRHPMDFLAGMSDRLVVIDEVQRMPELFQALRVLIDRDRRPGRFLLLGSSSPVIVRRTAESLAGRISYLDLFPLSMQETGAGHQQVLWLRGGFPDAFLARQDAAAFRVLDDLMRSFTERELPLLGLAADHRNTATLLRMITAVQGQPLNMSMLAKSLGMSAPTIERYLAFFEQAYMTFKLPSFQVNVRKRLTKAPKIYFTDTGILHSLAGIRTSEALETHPLRGVSWEGLVIQQVRVRARHRGELHYYRTQDGSELDLVITQGLKPVAAVEIKTTNAPTLSKGNQLAFEAVGAKLQLICTPGSEDYPYDRNKMVCSLRTLFDHLDKVLE
jgi:hypothetical protein